MYLCGEIHNHLLYTLRVLYIILMAKSSSKKKEGDKKKSSKKHWTYYFWDALERVANLIERIGVVNFLVSYFCVFVVSFAPSSQKQELIDRYALFKISSSQTCRDTILPVTIVISILGYIIITEAILFAYTRKNLQQRINDLSGKRTELQQQLFNK